MTISTEYQTSPLVLLADDDATMRVLVRHTLKKAGFRLVELEDGPEVVNVFQETRPDIVMLDVMMPSMNGFDVCAALRKLPTGRHVPILMVTGLDDMSSINQAYEAGATDFITKPITFPLLGHRLRYVLRASQAMENLGKSEASLAKAQAIAHLGSWEWDVVAHTINWSDEAFRIFGYKPHSLQPTEDLLLAALHPEDLDKFVAISDRCREAGEAGQLDYRIVLPDGNVRIINQQFGAVQDESGNTIMLRGTFQDITERKRVENELRQYRLHLEDLVEQRTAELQKAKELAEQANELKDKFVSLVAHDLRSPLSGMISALEYMHSDDETPLNEEHYDIVERLIDVSKSSVNMINEVLNISRLKTGKIQPQFQKLHVYGAVEKVIDNLAYLARQKGVHLCNEVEHDAHIFADPTLFGEVIQNLTSNAIKFCHKGNNVRFFIAENHRATLVVKDNGVGIAPDIQTKLFNIEEKTSRPGTSGEPGTGFGLPFSYDIVQAHYGDIWVESVVGEGAAFFVRFPETLPANAVEGAEE